MDSSITLLSWEHVGCSELNAIKIAKCMGQVMRPLRLTGEITGHDEYLAASVPRGGSLVASAETLVQLCGRSPLGLRLIALLKNLAANIFVYGFQPLREHSRILQELTAGTLSGVEALHTNDSHYAVDATSREICKQFAGLDFEIAASETNFAFIEQSGQGSCRSLIRIAQRPLFACLKQRGARVFVLACGQIADLEMLVPRKTSRMHFFSALVPLMMFIGCASGDGCWHNDKPMACFIVDDPLLRKQYGFLDYQKLSELMDRDRFSTSIAFIPWNYRRSDPRVAELLSSRPLAYSLCIHGCDHARGEFGSTDDAFLRGRARQAFEWMSLHRTLYGVDFDDVMVFPQGIFSTAAMNALQSCGYLAAVNSTPYPTDAEDGLTLGELLEVAVTRFSGLPLFTRRYPQNVPDLAFDLFLGKPALLVEHHGFFRDGYKALARAVEKVYALDEGLQWSSLASACSHACLKRVIPDGTVHVRFFTRRFSLRNSSERPQTYVLIRHASPRQQPRALLINSHPVDISFESDCVKAQISLEPGEIATVKVIQGETQPPLTHRGPHLLSRARAFIRRNLSEFRDNYVQTNRIFNRLARGGT